MLSTSFLKIKEFTCSREPICTRLYWFYKPNFTIFCAIFCSQRRGIETLRRFASHYFWRSSKFLALFFIYMTCYDCLKTFINTTYLHDIELNIIYYCLIQTQIRFTGVKLSFQTSINAYTRLDVYIMTLRREIPAGNIVKLILQSLCDRYSTVDTSQHYNGSKYCPGFLFFNCPSISHE